MEAPDNTGTSITASPKKRIESIDAFRGFTIAAMIFVIQVAGYSYLPLTFHSFGSVPVSTFKHAGEAEPEDWDFYEAGSKSPLTGKTPDHKKVHYPPAKMTKLGTVTATGSDSNYSVIIPAEEGGTTQTFAAVHVNTARPLEVGDEIVAMRATRNNDFWWFEGKGNGCTFTDLVAPFFVFIVGVCIPLSRQSRGRNWWKHAGVRTLLLILAGVVYISLILKLSWWWGILQAIGIAYFMGAACTRLPWIARWIVLAGIAAFHQWATLNWWWWVKLVHAGDTRPFMTIGLLRDYLEGRPVIANALKPLTLHCTPWASISWGLCTILGTFIGDALNTRNHRKVVIQCLVVGIVATAVGYIMHRRGFPINKDVVSVSYSLFTAGIGALTYLVFYALMDIWQIKRWAWFLTVFGSNALLAYFMQPVVRIFSTALGTQTFFGNRAGWDGMLWGFIWTALLWVVVLICNKRRIYWKL